jgi:predicted nuclease of predicted toxin-antitoxin system
VSLSLLMDVHVNQAVTHGLRQRGIDVLTAQEDSSEELDDDALLLRATELNRVVFSYDRDFSEVTARFQALSIHFAGVIATRRPSLRLAVCLEDLELICKALDAEDIADRLEFIPLQ